MPTFPFFSLAGLFKSAMCLCAKMSFTLYHHSPISNLQLQESV